MYTPPSNKIFAYHGSDGKFTLTHSNNDLFAIYTIKLTANHSRPRMIHNMQWSNVLSSLYIWLHRLDHNFRQTRHKLQMRNKPATTKQIHKKDNLVSLPHKCIALMLFHQQCAHISQLNLLDQGIATAFARGNVTNNQASIIRNRYASEASTSPPWEPCPT